MRNKFKANENKTLNDEKRQTMFRKEMVSTSTITKEILEYK